MPLPILGELRVGESLFSSAPNSTPIASRRPRRHRENVRPPYLKTGTRGYGTRHQQLRRKWSPKVAAGVVECWRWGELIHPYHLWDLGRIDGSKTEYAGPEHRRCNRATSGRQRQSRPW